MKKVTIEQRNGEGETLSISTATKRSLRKRNNEIHESINQIQVGVKKKKNQGRGSSNSSGQGQGQGSGVKEKGPINNLPPEMLMQILKCVDTRSLFKIRLVCRQWMEISGGILTRRCDAYAILKFEQHDQKILLSNFPARKMKGKSLQDFVKSIKKSKSTICPFVRFSSRVLSPSLFNCKDWIKFLSYFAPSNSNPYQWTENTYLELHLKFVRFDDLAMNSFWEKLGDLLVNKIPHLEQLSLDIQFYFGDQHMKLFPPSQALENNTAEAQVPVQLANLKLLDIKSNRMILNFPGIVEDLLNAAVNLRSIKMPIQNLEDLHFLHSHGKLHLLRETEIDITPAFFSTLQNQNQNSNKNVGLLSKLLKLELKLEVLHLTTVQKCDEIATNFLGNLFESSKDTLKELELPPLGFLPHLSLPIFKNLRKVKIHILYNELNLRGVFPPKIRQRNPDIFPAVSDLDFKFGNRYQNVPLEAEAESMSSQDFEESIPRFPSVQSLALNDIWSVKHTANGIYTVSLMCPNLKKLYIHKNPKDKSDKRAPRLNFARVAPAIWLNMKHLEYLEVDLDVDVVSDTNDPANFTSCFTGAPAEYFRMIYEMMRKTQTGKIDKMSGNGTFKDEIDVKKLKSVQVRVTEPGREQASIFDMKDLRTLIINPYSGGKLLDRRIELTLLETQVED